MCVLAQRRQHRGVGDVTAVPIPSAPHPWVGTVTPHGLIKGVH